MSLASHDLTLVFSCAVELAEASGSYRPEEYAHILEPSSPDCLKEDPDAIRRWHEVLDAIELASNRLKRALGAKGPLDSADYLRDQSKPTWEGFQSHFKYSAHPSAVRQALCKLANAAIDLSGYASVQVPEPLMRERGMRLLQQGLAQLWAGMTAAQRAAVKPLLSRTHVAFGWPANPTAEPPRYAGPDGIAVEDQYRVIDTTRGFAARTPDFLKEQQRMLNAEHRLPTRPSGSASEGDVRLQQNNLAECPCEHDVTQMPATLEQLRDWLAERVRWLRDWHLAAEEPKPLALGLQTVIVQMFGSTSRQLPSDPQHLSQWASQYIWRFSEITAHQAHAYLDRLGILDGPAWPSPDIENDMRALIVALDHLAALLPFVAQRLARMESGLSPHLVPAAAIAPSADVAGATEVTSGRETHRNTFRLEGEVWTLSFAAKTIRLKDSRGLKYLARLLASKYRNIDAVALRSVATGNVLVKPSAGIEILDQQALREYEAEFESLTEQLEEAKKFNDLAKQEQLQGVINNLAEQLEAARGLGNRTRRGKDESANVRTSIKNAISRAIEKQIQKVHPELARHLDTFIQTGQSLCYSPDPDVDWEL